MVFYTEINLRKRSISQRLVLSQKDYWILAIEGREEGEDGQAVAPYYLHFATRGFAIPADKNKDNNRNKLCIIGNKKPNEKIPAGEDGFRSPTAGGLAIGQEFLILGGTPYFQGSENSSSFLPDISLVPGRLTPLAGISSPVQLTRKPFGNEDDTISSNLIERLHPPLPLSQSERSLPWSI